MPRYSWLFTKVDTLNITSEDVTLPRGITKMVGSDIIVAKKEALDLVAYIKSLQQFSFENTSTLYRLPVVSSIRISMFADGPPGKSMGGAGGLFIRVKLIVNSLDVVEERRRTRCEFLSVDALFVIACLYVNALVWYDAVNLFNKYTTCSASLSLFKKHSHSLLHNSLLYQCEAEDVISTVVVSNMLRS
jgi:hypothetical protein